MSVVYRVYKNNGTGGPVDYSTIVATVTTPTYTGAALASPSDTTFAVRSYDTVLGLEDLNRDVITRVVIDGSGTNITGLPQAPISLSARPVGTTSVRVQVAFHPGKQARPTGFKVWVTAGSTVNYAASPNQTIAYPTSGGLLKLFSTIVTGLASATTYAIGVRAYNSVGTESNTLADSTTTVASAPLAVLGLVASTTLASSRSPSATPGTAP